MTTLKGAALVSCGLMALLLAACGGSSGSSGSSNGSSGGSGQDNPGGSDGSDQGNSGDSSMGIVRGKQLPDSDLSPIVGYEDTFDFNVVAALRSAAGATPNGASQASLVDGDNKTMSELQVRLVRNDAGDLVYEGTDEDGTKYSKGDGFKLSLFTSLTPGIEPDLTSYPHQLFGIWEWGGRVGTFWSNSQPLPETVSLRTGGNATYMGDAVGLHAAGTTTTKFLANVSLKADFENLKVSGMVDNFRSFSGTPLGDNLSITLGEATFSPQGNPFHGNTTGSLGSGKWGARWANENGSTMGGTFGFAKTDNSLAVLGAFNAAIPGSPSSGNPDDAVASPGSGG